MSITVKVDMSGVGRKLDKISSNKKLGQLLANEAAKGMDKYVPMRTGALKDFVVPTPFHVRYAAPYAKYVFNGRGMKFRKDHHPNATSHWDKAYVAAGGAEKLGKAGTDFLKGM